MTRVIRRDESVQIMFLSRANREIRVFSKLRGFVVRQRSMGNYIDIPIQLVPLLRSVSEPQALRATVSAP